MKKLNVGFMLLVSVLLAHAASGLAADGDQAKSKIDPAPAGWKITDFGMTILGINTDLAAHCQLTSGEKAPVSLRNWAQGLEDALKKGNTFTDFKASDLKPGKYGGHDAFEYDYSGATSYGTVHHRVFFMGIGDNFVMLDCFTDPGHWDAAQKSFEELANNVK
jgi:hypothetical protein